MTTSVRRWVLIGLLSILTLIPVQGFAQDTGEAGFPVTIEHKYGSTTLTQEPQRVVTVGLTDHDAVLALGVVPVATTEWFGMRPGAVFPWAEKALGDAEPPQVLTQTDGIEFEKIAALRPDVILAQYAGLTQDDYDKLARIAPTVAQLSEYGDYTIPWQELTRRIGQALGRANQAERLVSDVEERFARVREEHPEFVGATAVAAYDFGDGMVGVYGPKDPRARILAALGFETPAQIAELTREEYYAEIGGEQIELLDADLLLMIVYTTPEQALVASNPLYQGLDLAREGRDIALVSRETDILSEDGVLVGAYSFSSVLSLPYLLDRLVPMLSAAVDGDPATKVAAT
jgi:iron complex transport system substrate-binding protein